MPGDFLPSSSITFLRLLLDAASSILRPGEPDPVNVILRMYGCRAGAFPVSAAPHRNCTTPKGNPAVGISLAIPKKPRGDFSDNLRITVFPTARARAAFYTKVIKEAFQAHRAVQKPISSY